MKELIIQANEGGNYLNFKLINEEFQNNVSTLTIDYDRIADLDIYVFSNLYQNVIEILTDKNMDELCKEYDKVKFLDKITGDILFEQTFTKS